MLYRTTTTPTPHSRDIQGIFFHSLKDQLGTKKEVIYFHPQTLYPTSHYLQPLANPFSDDEIEKAVKELANNKASGLDGIPNEFLKKYWTDHKGIIFGLFKKFFDNQLDLLNHDRANIIMVPKKADPQKLSDYRPISVINLFPKFLSKVLANRLSYWLSDGIHPGLPHC
jgi:hypothetical protein